MTDIYHYDKKNNEQAMISTGTEKRKKEQYIEDLKEGDTINDVFAVKIKNAPRSYRKGTMFDFVVVDKTGEIAVKYWGGDKKDRVKRLFDSFRTGDVIQIRAGSVETYNDQLQVSINEISGGLRRCSDDEYVKSDFIAALDEHQISSLFSQVKTIISEIEQPQLKKLLQLFFEDPTFVHQYTHSPSAMTFHHNYVGGNLQHSLGVARLVKTICEYYPGLNKDLILTGALLHDVGKLREYQTTTSIEKTDEGNFIGHIVIGERWIREKIAKIREDNGTFDERLELYLSHMILSHHGKYEYGSPRMPKIAEAAVLAQADLMDSQVKNYLQSQEDQKKNNNEDWAFVWDPDVGRKKAMYLPSIFEGDQPLKNEESDI
jgi:3'-5' exoribonuclease